MRDLKNTFPVCMGLLIGALFVCLSCGGEKGTDSDSNGPPAGKELQLIRAHFDFTIQERVDEWRIVGPARNVDVSFYPQLDEDHITLGRAAATTDINGRTLYICVAGSLYVGDTFDLNAAEIRTGCNTDGWQCTDQGYSNPQTFTVIQGETDYHCSVSSFATPE